MNQSQSFIDADAQSFEELDVFPGASLSFLAEPTHGGSIHRLKMKKNTVIPPHTHPGDEFVLVLEGSVRTGGRTCEKGAFWHTPAGVKQGPQEALTDVEILTVRHGPMGEFE